MNYETFQPSAGLESLVSCYWTLEVPANSSPQKQRIIPDGTIEMAFILGDNIKRYTTEDEFVLQPRAMVIGQINEPFYIEPTGHVNTFAIRFYPYGFANFVTMPIKNLANTETPLELLFGEKITKDLEQKIIEATSSSERITIIESFLLERLNKKVTIDKIVQTTIDTLIETNGSASIITILKEDSSKRRHLERSFLKQIGISPKQLGKVIRLQSVLKIMLNKKSGNLTDIAYESEYFDQAHFIKDFKEFTGINPKAFLDDESMALSSLFYK